MKRYTKNGKIILDGTAPKCEKEKLAFEKLSLVEDIEEELGIDLITLFKTLNGGIYYKDFLDNKIKRTNNLSLANYNNGGYALANKSHYFETKYYRKTWALTKEELL